MVAQDPSWRPAGRPRLWLAGRRARGPRIFREGGPGHPGVSQLLGRCQKRGQLVVSIGQHSRAESLGESPPYSSALLEAKAAATFHKFTVISLEAVASVLPSGEKAA